jgi:hypothetical protein
MPKGIPIVRIPIDDSSKYRLFTCSYDEIEQALPELKHIGFRRPSPWPDQVKRTQPYTYDFAYGGYVRDIFFRIKPKREFNSYTETY